MRKVHLLLALSTLLVISIVIILIICLRHHSPDSTTTLKVVLNGPYVIVREKSRPDMITVFSPRDNQGLHRFYSNDLKEGRIKTFTSLLRSTAVNLRRICRICQLIHIFPRISWPTLRCGNVRRRAIRKRLSGDNRAATPGEDYVYVSSASGDF